MKDPLHVTGRLIIPGHELEYSANRTSGPGGQATNKTSSRVTLKWNLIDSEALNETTRNRLRANLASRLDQNGYLQLHSDVSRSQLKNKLDARHRLAELIRNALVVRRSRRATKPTKGSKERRLNSKKKHSAKKSLRRNPNRDD
ncbi:MAG: alternative ribosome rescue aminoacyl-tRNA hydrolase ArfB [Myxococcota bacterium]|nr:alternative ribosome rescue aminoacyl-tRNA hydrolase ArfB [Myxococcota bacterium]